MVKFRKRVDFKGKRWAKGQSSSSNPEANKYRNAAKSRFFQENLGNTGLTENAVRSHELMYGSKLSKSSQSLTAISDSTSVTDSSVPRTFKTFETFASDWSNCSNVSFNKLLNNFTIKSALHKEMLAILAALTEVIKEKEGTENSTEYFAALMTLLDGVTQDDDTSIESLCAMLSLLSMVIKAVPTPVLQLKFSDASKTLLNLLSKYVQSNNQSLIRSIIGCLSVLLRAQDVGVWNQSITMKVYESILTFCTHSKPKIRKAAQHACCAILKASACVDSAMNEIDCVGKPVIHHPAAHVTSAYITRNIELNPALGGSTTTLHVLSFLKDIIGALNKSNVKACCESILKVMTLGNVIIISTGLQTLHALFLSKPCPHSTCTPQLNAQIINALYDYQPPSSDVQPTLAWLTTLQQAFCNLALIDLGVCMSNLYRYMSICTSLWLSDRIEVVNGATHTISVLIQDCIEKASNVENVNKYKTIIRKIFELFEQGLTYQYNQSWKQVLFVLTTMFKSSGHACHDFMTKCLKNLAELRDSYNFPHVYELDHALGAAVRSMGPEIVLQCIPYQITFNEKSNEIKRSWLLPVLKANVQNSSIQFFIDYFLPLATICRNKAQEYKSSNTTGNISYDLLQTQIWSLLPSFCTKPRDLENFGNIAKMLGNVLTSYKDLRMTVMLALRKLIEFDPKSPILKKYAKNYLPILFNIYTTYGKGSDESVRISTHQTIVLYGSIAEPDIRSALLKSALSKLGKTNEDSDDTVTKSKEETKFLKSSILDIIRSLFTYQSKDDIKEIVSGYVLNIVQNSKDTQETKKGYRIIRELCESTQEGPKQYISENIDSILAILLEPMETKSLIPSQSSRIKSLIALLPVLEEDQLLSLISPAVSGIKSINTQCRCFAFELVAKLADRMIELAHNDGLFMLIDHLSVGLEGNTKIISGSILALASVTHHSREYLEGTETLNTVIENILVLLTSSTREIVGSCLSYLKLMLTSFHKDDLQMYMPKIVKNISNMVQDCKRHFRCKIKDIFVRLLRKYGDNVVFPLVPSHDEVLIKQVKNLIRLRRQKEKNKKARKSSESEEEDEFSVKSKPKTINEILEEIEKDDDDEILKEDGGDDKTEDRKKKKKRRETFIQEDEDDILDFTDVSNMNKISTTKPTSGHVNAPSVQQNKKKDQFKMSADGRLIITESGGESDEDETALLKNMKIKEDSGDEEDQEDDAKKILMNSRKRKRQTDTSSMKSEPVNKYQAGGSGIHRPINKNENKKSAKDSTPGDVYKSKKSQGDMKRKGLPDPYAYVPLSRKSLNKRKKNKSSGQFKNIIKGAKKGAQLGKSMKSKNKKKVKK